jgi:PDZ domain
MALPSGTQTQQWQEGRSVTPAMNNYTGRYASAPRLGAASDSQQEPYQTVRSMTPNGRGYTGAAGGATAGEPRTPSSTGLIRLSLKKPMGIVFEPMYDPNNAAIQRGVRICDLPRTGAAALSRKLQVGDELLQINDTTVSRLTFDEIMDFIIEADPESVNLLFRRPRKETLQARQGVQQKLHAAANKDAVATVKWVDEEAQESGKKSKKKKKKSKRSKKGSISDEEETLQSKSTAGEDSYLKATSKKSRSSRSKSGKGENPYETESFLDMLIDTICSDSSNVCRDTFRRNDDEYVSEDESFATEEDTYATFEEDQPRKVKDEKAVSKKKYEDDGTLETVETRDRPVVKPAPQPVPPLGLAPNPPPAMMRGGGGGEETDDDGNPAPIKELEYDDRIEADVSVMESLGGPSLLIEKQRAAQSAAAQQMIPADILEKYGLDYPVMTGMTREQTISADPVRFYTHVVKQLLQEHEPEKVRLLDKLLAKYKGREDHLVQKLSVRYNKEEQQQQHDAEAFTDAVKKNKQSLTAAAAVNTAKERLQKNHVVQDDDDDDDEDIPQDRHQWPEKETKEQDDGDEASESGSEYSRDSVDGTSPAVIAQVSELLNYVYGKTSVPGQIDRVSTIMRAYEGREAVLLELLETKALIKANKEKENADTLPSFLRNSQLTSQAAQQQSDAENNGLPPVTPMATNPPQGGTVINDDISSMSGVSSPAAAELLEQHEVEAPPHMTAEKQETVSPMKEVPKLNSSVSSMSRNSKPPVTPDKRKKKGLFGGLFGKKKTKDSVAGSAERPGSRLRNGRKLKGVKSVEGSI